MTNNLMFFCSSDFKTECLDRVTLKKQTNNNNKKNFILKQRIPNTPEIKPVERISHYTPKLETLVLTYFAHARQNTYVSDMA